MRNSALVAVLFLGMLVVAPNWAEAARAVHGFGCNNCHRSGVSFYDLGGNNVCISCHQSGLGQTNVLMGNVWQSRIPQGYFSGTDASNAVSSYPVGVTPDAQTSHMWSTKTDVKPEAGARAPALYATQFNGQYGVSRGKLTCTRCHDPHGDYDTNPTLMKVTTVADAMCRDCHRDWDASNNRGYLTHPMVADYVDVATTKPTKYYPSPVNVNAGDIRLVPNPASGTQMVSCTSCHGQHYTDSNSTTTDGRANQSQVNTTKGDGHILRTDGPTRTNKSTLCQACHKYKNHGDTGAKHSITIPGVLATTTVGCLECHSGHSFNAGSPQFYVLRTGIGAPYNVTFAAPYNYSIRPTNYLAASPWNDSVNGQANGYCEKCHGDADLIPGSQHTTTAKCLNCHIHDNVDYSFQNTANASACGDCHGFPPHLNSRGDRLINAAYEGGYAYISATNNYTAAPDYNAKDESLTPHNAHAAAGVLYDAAHPTKANQPIGLDTDYRMGNDEYACSTCHGIRPSHNTGSTTVLGGYQDIQFDDRATVLGQTAPSYSGAGRETCLNTYCHSNGGRRTVDNPTESNRSWYFTETPYVGNPTNSGWKNAKGSLITATFGSATECSACHGNTVATMHLTTGKRNSQTHNKHLNRNYTCNVCHVHTATNNTYVPKIARDVADNAIDLTKGAHVNYKVDVYFDAAYPLGAANLSYKSSYGDQYLGTAPNDKSGYASATGTCQVYCHSNGGTTFAPITYVTMDWDSPSTTFTCASCHGNPPTSGSHARHVTDANGPTLACAECHVNAGSYTTAGGHADHINGAVNHSAARCSTCHAIDGTETAPTWGQSTTMDCKTCHSGTRSTFETKTAPDKSTALTSGHNRPTASGNYPVPAPGNLPANKKCDDCHDSKTKAGHFDNISNDDKLVKTGGGFPATYDAIGFCGACHGSAPTWPASKAGIVSHMSKACTACHDPHGAATNIFMIRPTSTGNYSGTVSFSSATHTGAESYDEDDGLAGNPGEINADDLCATCHTYGTLGSITGHNNKENEPTTPATSHHQGENCMTGGCHLGHTETAGAFASGGGDSCEDCHGNPPTATDPRYASGNGTTFGAHAKHVFKTAGDDPAEDRTDCEICHPGAATYALGHKNGGPLNLDSRITVLPSGNYSCGTLNNDLGCHKSDTTDGFWKDTTDYAGNGLRCTACHNGNTFNDGVLANAAPDNGKHAEHNTWNKACTDCHNGGFAITDTTHITNHLPIGDTTNDSDVLADKSKADLGEGTVARTGGTMTYDQVTNFTCAGGIGLGCHNSKTTPNWRTFTGPIACTQCHNPATSDAADPKTGLHNISVAASAAGVQKHDGSTAPISGCTACHNSTKPTTHADGAWLADSNNNQTGAQPRFLLSGLTYGEAAANRSTCSDGVGTFLDACHSDDGLWKRRWSTEADSTATASGSARCNVCHGQYNNLAGSGGTGWNEGTSHYRTYGGALSTRGATHRSVAGEQNACEDCHSYTTLNTNHDTTPQHFVEVNNDALDIIVTESAQGWVYCAKCHSSADPATSGTKTIPKSLIFTRQLVAGVNDPKQECNGCHGVGGNGRYWPVAAYGTDLENPENDRGRHEIHMGRLAQARFYTGAATPADAVTQLLADVDTRPNQIELCKYCHPGLPGQDAGHNNGTTNVSSAPTTFMHALWTDTTVNDDDATYTGTGANNTGTCAAVNCHNGKNTNSIAGFTWHSTSQDTAGTGKENCLICHNDITVTTPNTTGATHQAHLTPTKFGRAVVCGDCHGGGPSWSSYTVPASGHINGTFQVAGGTVIDGTVRSYTGVYTNAATRTVGSCNTNLCHNNGAGGTPYSSGAALGAYNWQTALTDCTACHRNDSTLGSSHTPHLTAAVATFGKTPVCTDCHEAVSTTDMTAKANHINGAVTILPAMTYSGAGTLNVVIGGANTYGACTGSCHTDGQGGSPVTAANWNTTYTNCNICHGLPNTGAKTGNGGTRHQTHVAANSAFVAAPTCGQCHLDATTTTYSSANHFSGTVQTGNKITSHTAGTATCTNTCHVVDASRGDWLDTADLGCIDCHTGTGVTAKIAGDKSGIGGNNYLPQSGLHTGTLTISANTHDDFFKSTKAGADGSATCLTCHTASPSRAHLNNFWDATIDAPGNTAITLAPNVVYLDAATPTCGPTSGLSTCHADGGQWKRRWSTTATQTGGPECNNCHGVWTTWTNGVRPDHVIDRNGDGISNEIQPNHSGCKTCHGFNSDADKDANYLPSMHRDNNITLNSATGYSDTTFGCESTSCHGGGGAEGHGLGDSFIWNVQTVPFTVVGGTCDGCHGYPPVPGDGKDPQDGLVTEDGKGAHQKHVDYLKSIEGGVVLDPVNDQFGDAKVTLICGSCHDMASGNHKDTTRLFNFATQHYFTPSPPSYIGVPGLPDDATNPKKCMSVGCHFQATPQWKQ